MGERRSRPPNCKHCRTSGGGGGDGRDGCRERSVEVNSMHACGRVAALSGDWRLGQYTTARASIVNAI